MQPSQLYPRSPEGFHDKYMTLTETRSFCFITFTAVLQSTDGYEARRSEMVGY